jgi:endonuclease/exonuclease/phosphatase family metal-dependent hydrolase
MAPARNDPCPCGSGLRFKHCHGSAVGPDALAAQGVDAHRRGDLAAAERAYRQALAQAPEHPLALHYLGVLLYQQGQPALALPLLDRAVALVPAEPDFHNNRGLALAALGRGREAIDAYRGALERKPSHEGAWSNLGLALQAAGDVAGAIDAFRRGLAVAPDFPQLHWNLSLALLLTGDFDNGWREYEWRLRTPELAATMQSFRAPRWDGGDPVGRTILVAAEQGLGDTLQFLRFATTLHQGGARVIAGVPPTLVKLAATVPGVAQAVPLDAGLPTVDAYVPVMSLPLLLGAAAGDVSVPYLRAGRVALPDDRVNAGLCWAGAPANTNDARRSIALATLAPLLDIAGIRWYSLKRDGEALGPRDLATAERLVALPQRNDFDGLAALIASLDVVVTVDTSIAHLAGALGKRVLMLIPYAPDWRWLLERSDTPWYPTMRIFRQRDAGDWTHPIASAADALREEIG